MHQTKHRAQCVYMLLNVLLYLSSSSSHHQLVAVFAHTDLLDAQSGVIAVRVETAHLHTFIGTHVKRGGGGVLGGFDAVTPSTCCWCYCSYLSTSKMPTTSEAHDLQPVVLQQNKQLANLMPENQKQHLSRAFEQKKVSAADLSLMHDFI